VLVGLGLLFAVLGLMQRDMTFVARPTADRARSIFDDAQHQLEQLAGATGGACSEQAHRRDAAHGVPPPVHPRSRRVQGPTLICTNLGELVPPLVVEEAGRLVLPPPGQITSCRRYIRCRAANPSSSTTAR
jgi:hypothetical protein